MGAPLNHRELGDGCQPRGHPNEPEQRRLAHSSRRSARSVRSRRYSSARRINPCLIPIRISSTRLCAFNLPIRFVRCRSTVFTLIPIWLAISPFVRPLLIAWMISRSRAVSFSRGPGGVAPAGDAAPSVTRASEITGLR